MEMKRRVFDEGFILAATWLVKYYDTGLILYIFGQPGIFGSPGCLRIERTVGRQTKRVRNR